MSKISELLLLKPSSMLRQKYNSTILSDAICLKPTEHNSRKNSPILSPSNYGIMTGSKKIFC